MRTATGIIIHTPHIELVRDSRLVGVLEYEWNNVRLTASTLSVVCEETGTLQPTEIQKGLGALLKGVPRGGFGVLWEREDLQKPYLQQAFTSSLQKIYRGFYNPLKREYDAQRRGEELDHALAEWRRSHVREYAA